MHAPYYKHHRVSSYIKVHQNTHDSVRHEVIWKWLITTLFSFNFASTKFRNFRDFEKIAKNNTRVISHTWRLKLLRLILYNINKWWNSSCCFITVFSTCLSFVFCSFLFNFVHQSSSTTSLSLSELSSGKISLVQSQTFYLLVLCSCLYVSGILQISHVPLRCALFND